jgi:hypothetical protein
MRQTVGGGGKAPPSSVAFDIAASFFIVIASWSAAADAPIRQMERMDATTAREDLLNNILIRAFNR